LLTAVNNGNFLINGLRNRDLQALLYSPRIASGIERRRRSAAVSRKLRMLRAHGLIQKVPHTHRYQVTAAGRSILLTVMTTAHTSLQQLNQLAGHAA
jgi:ribosomal protein S19E (S16A)